MRRARWPRLTGSRRARAKRRSSPSPPADRPRARRSLCRPLARRLQFEARQRRRPRLSAARSTSSLVIRPPGPVASTVARSMPSSPARLRAAGEALTRPLASRAACRPSRATRGDAPPAAAVAPLVVVDQSLHVFVAEIFARRGDHGDGAHHRHLAPHRGDDLTEHTAGGRLDVVDRLLGLHGKQRNALVTGSPSSRDQSVMVPEVMVSPHLGMVTIVGMRDLRVGQSVSRSVVKSMLSDDQTISRTASAMRSGLGT